METAAHSQVLDQDQLDRWERDGYLVVRQLFSAQEMSELSQEAWQLTRRHDLIDKRNLRCRFQQTHDNSECLWETFDPVIDLGQRCEQIANDSRLLNILHDLYCEPACLFKDKLIFKQPGTQGYNLHQDWISWPGFPRSFLTVLIPLDPACKSNGCTEVFPGYHGHGSLTLEDGEFHQLSSDMVDQALGVKLVMEPGDIAIFGGFTPHRSGPNLSDSWRRQLYLSYNARSDGGDRRAEHYVEFHQYLRKRYTEFELNDTFFQ